MTESILTSIKKLLGLDESYDYFDADIIMHINSVFMTLRQIGVGPEKGFLVESKDDEWSDFIKDMKLLSAVKSYTYLKVKLLFDPPSNATLIDSINKSIDEFQWRLYSEVNYVPKQK